MFLSGPTFSKKKGHQPFVDGPFHKLDTGHHADLFLMAMAIEVVIPTPNSKVALD